MPEDREAGLTAELKTYEALRESLEKNHMGKFVVIRDGDLIVITQAPASRRGLPARVRRMASSAPMVRRRAVSIVERMSA